MSTSPAASMDIYALVKHQHFCLLRVSDLRRKIIQVDEKLQLILAKIDATAETGGIISNTPSTSHEPQVIPEAARSRSSTKNLRQKRNRTGRDYERLVKEEAEVAKALVEVQRQITANYRYCTTTHENGLVGYWPRVPGQTEAPASQYLPAGTNITQYGRDAANAGDQEVWRRFTTLRDSVKHGRGKRCYSMSFL